MFTTLLLTAAMTAETPIPLWAGDVPHAVGKTDADTPTLTAYPAEGTPTGAAVVICPGGGYGFLAMDHEGKQVGEFFAKLGISAFVLKYRIVAKDRAGPLHPAPLIDAQRALRWVRANAAQYKADPAKIGLMGFSAGGHLASTAGTHFDAGNPTALNPVNRASCRPDFLILAYPVVSMEDGVTHGGSRKNLIGDKPDAKLVEFYSNEKHVTKETPPTFIFHTHPDTAVVPENAIRFYLALKAAKVPAEMHIYEKGIHGVGLGRDPNWTKGEKSVATWPDRLTDWLRGRGLVGK